MAFKITRFDGTRYAFLSNFYTGEGGDVTINGLYYPTTEHAFQAGKNVKRSVRRQVAGCATPGYAKRMGRAIKAREAWDVIKVYYMLMVLRRKFKHTLMRKQLLNTVGQELIEGNTWGDRFWGQCPVGEGHNVLGKLLIHVREEAIRGKQFAFRIDPAWQEPWRAK